MYSNRIQYAIDNFIKNDYFLKMQNEYYLEEKSKDGESILHLTVDGENICVEDFDNQSRGKCNFFKESKAQGLKKCMDHFILKRNGEKWDLHMIEMKTSVGHSTWSDIKHKNRASYFNIKALCVVLGIDIDKVYSYTTFENEKFESLEYSANPKAFVPQLGKKPINFKLDEWDKNIIKIPMDDKDEIIVFTHTAIKMIRDDKNVLKGNFELNM